jgi:hypothetical protein
MHKPSSLVPAFVISLATIGLAACGGSSSTPNATATGAPSTGTPTAAATAAPTTAAAVTIACPTAGTVNSALGLNVGAPTSQPAADLPPGDTGVTCQYLDLASKSVVVIDYGTGPVSEPFIAKVEAGEKAAAEGQGDTYSETSVSGVGDQAVIVTLSKAGTPSLDGILAVSGSTGIVITTLPPASQSHLESFASQLLG